MLRPLVQMLMTGLVHTGTATSITQAATTSLVKLIGTNAIGAMCVRMNQFGNIVLGKNTLIARRM